MTLSEFLQLFYSFYGTHHSTSDFVIVIFDNALEVTEKNPLADNFEGLRKIFNGTRDLSKKNASFILNKIDKYRFIDFLSSISDDGSIELCKTLQKKGIDINEYNFAEICADIFVNIIKDYLSSKENKKRILSNANLKLEASNEFFYSDSFENSFLFLMEVNWTCPICQKSLTATDENCTKLNYVITTIYPSTLPLDLELEFAEFEYLKMPIHDNDNKIALCLNCDNEYKIAINKTKITKLISIKKKISSAIKANSIIQTTSLDENIQMIVDGLSSFSHGDFDNQLSKSALRIKEKVDPRFRLLIDEIEFNVSRYYTYVEELFIEAESNGKLDFNLIAQEINLCYKKLAKLSLSQEKIYFQLTKWIIESTKVEDFFASSIIVSFFIQNCEVFDALSK